MLPARSSHNSNVCAHGEQIGGRTCRAMHWDARSDKCWQDDVSEGRRPSWAEGASSYRDVMDDAFGESCGIASRPAARKRMEAIGGTPGRDRRYQCSL